MSPKKIRWLVICFVAILGAAGCKCNNTAVEDFEVIADNPILGLVVSTLNPTFSWTANKSCDPDEYDVYITEDVRYGGDTVYADVAYDDVPYTLTGDSLLPGRSYLWKARAINVWTSYEDPSANSPYNEYSQFFTGPVCSGESLIAPDLEFPAPYSNPDYDNWITHNSLQEFKWTYTGGCLPISYDFQFATDPGFTDIVLSGTTTTPYNQSIYESFPNCSTLFWRIAANDGTSTGPWSDTWSFHWVTDETCWQNHYISDDAARISVWLYHDNCSHTGDAAGMRLTSSGCKLDKNGVTLVGDGERTFPPDSHLWDYEGDLGSGPCPSTGLDHKDSSELFMFNVLAPGTYCVSMTRNQIVQGGAINLMHGIWTDPRVTGDVAYKTIELGPGTTDVNVYFGWDEYEHTFVMPRLPETKNCRICPDPIGPVVDILMEGSLVELFGRDRNSQWKLTYAQGVPCYLWLMDEKINQELSLFEDFDWRAEDLEFYPQPPPCPKPETKPDSGPAPGPAPQPKDCSEYTDSASCRLDSRCKWEESSVRTPYCTTR